MTSYKSLYQEAQEKIAQQQGEIERLKSMIEASPDEHLRELDRTRKVVDLAGIARHMRVERFTPQQWQQRGLLPPRDFPDIKEPLWYASTIITQFVEPTRRVWYDEPEGEGLSPAA